MYIDSNLTRKLHILKVYNKISRTIGIMSKLKQVLPLTILVTIVYNSLIFPYLNYGILVWGASVNRLIRLQKKAVRLAAKAKYNAHTGPIFKLFKLLTVNDILKWQD